MRWCLCFSDLDQHSVHQGAEWAERCVSLTLLTHRLYNRQPKRSRFSYPRVTLATWPDPARCKWHLPGPDQQSLPSSWSGLSTKQSCHPASSHPRPHHPLHPPKSPLPQPPPQQNPSRRKSRMKAGETATAGKSGGASAPRATRRPPPPLPLQAAPVVGKTLLVRSARLRPGKAAKQRHRLRTVDGLRVVRSRRSSLVRALVQQHSKTGARLNPLVIWPSRKTRAKTTFLTLSNRAMHRGSMGSEKVAGVGLMWGREKGLAREGIHPGSQVQSRRQSGLTRSCRRCQPASSRLQLQPQMGPRMVRTAARHSRRRMLQLRPRQRQTQLPEATARPARQQGRRRPHLGRTACYRQGARCQVPGWLRRGRRRRRRHRRRCRSSRRGRRSR